MTRNQKIGLGIGGALLLLWLLKVRKAITATVTFEAPTTSGPGAGAFGGTGFDVGYGVPPMLGPPIPDGIPTPTGFNGESEIDRAIRVSNEVVGGETVARDGFVGLASDFN